MRSETTQATESGLMSDRDLLPGAARSGTPQSNANTPRFGELRQRLDEAFLEHPLIAVSAAVAAGAVVAAATRRSTDSPSRTSGLGSKLVSIAAAAALRHGVKIVIAKLAEANAVSDERRSHS